MRQSVWIDTGWACGGLYVTNGVVTGGAPIFRKFIGQTLVRLSRSYDVRVR